MPGNQPAVEIRQLTQLSEFEEVLRLQEAIWGFGDIDVLPVRFFVVVSKVGGHVFGAFDDGMMVGFCFAIPGIKPDGSAYLHSHMLGVLPAYNNAGIGRRLKLRQRDEALSRGIGLIEWTFDPLELKNAFFNIERLGAIVRRYHENQYGITASPLHGGLPTDRCYAEWWLTTPRVREALAVSSPAAPARETPAFLRISYPADIGRIRAEDPARARSIQRENGEKFHQAFRQGLAVNAFERGATECSYLLGPWR